MQKIVLYIAVLGMSYAIIKDLTLYGYYFANKAYVMANLCVNRYDANSTCHGSCMMSKHLEEDQSHGANFPVRQVQELTSQIQYCNSIEGWTMMYSVYIELDSPLYVLKSILSDYTDRIFHPPQALFYI